MEHTDPRINSLQMPNATYQPWAHNPGAFQLYQVPNSNYSAQNPPGVFAGSMSSAGAIVDQSMYTEVITEHAQPGAVDEEPLEYGSNECEAVPCPMSTEGRKGSRKRSRDWTEEETMVLVECKRAWFEDVGSRYRKQKSSATNWDAIAEEVTDSLGTSRTGEQCRLRWDTLVKSHRLIKERCVESGKEYAEVLEEDKRSLKLATSLKPEWYEVIDNISGKARSQKQGNPGARKSQNGGAGDGPASAGTARTEAGPHRLVLEGGPALGTGSIPAAPGCRGMFKGRREAVQRFRSLGPQLRSTFIDLILSYNRLLIDMRLESLSQTCEWLAVVQGRRRLDVYLDVSILIQVKLVHVKLLPPADDEVEDSVEIDYLCFHVFGNFVEKLIKNNHGLDTHCRSFEDNRKLFVGRELMTPHQVRVLDLFYCRELESIDVRGLVKLRSLIVCGCSKLKEIVGWKYLRELGWLEILDCTEYVEYPDLRDLPSLRVCYLDRSYICDGPVGHKFDISHCVRLHRLEIHDDGLLEESGDLSSLKCLEELNITGCSALLAVTGLSSLHFLNRLDLSGCTVLGSLSDVGHMKELVYLDISESGVEEILGIEKLMSLVRLCCSHSKLKHLPNLHHLPHLQKVSLKGTPLIEEDPSSFYFDKSEVVFNREDKSVLVDVTFSSDIECSGDEDEHIDVMF